MHRGRARVTFIVVALLFLRWSPQILAATPAAIMAIFHDEIEIEDFEYDDESDSYTYPCPCGDMFRITKVR